MSEEKQTRAATSIAALKNANKHMTELLQTNENMNQVMGSVASDLNAIARLTGDFKVNVYVEGGWKDIPIKSYLNSLATKLENGRK
jgi:hypothetical protein